MTWTAFYLTMSAVALVAAAFSHERDRGHALQIAGMLAVGCAAYNATWITANKWCWPVLDAAATWFVAVRQRRMPSDWKGLILAAYAGQMIAHVRWTLGDHFYGSFVGYGLTLNLLFLVQLGAVASSGGLRLGRRLRCYVVGRLDFGGRRGVGLLLRRPCRPSVREEGAA